MKTLQAVELLHVSVSTDFFMQLLGDVLSVPSGLGSSEELNKNCLVLRLIQLLQGAHKKNLKAYFEITGKKNKTGGWQNKDKWA